MDSKITPAELKRLRVAVDKALKPVAEEFNLKELHLDNISYTDYTFTGKLKGLREVQGINDPKTEEVNKQAKLKQYAGWFGVTEEDLEKTYIINGIHCTITEIKPQNTKYPIILTPAGADSRGYKVSLDQLKHFKTV